MKKRFHLKVSQKRYLNVFEKSNLLNFKKIDYKVFIFIFCAQSIIKNEMKDQLVAKLKNLLNDKWI